ncbi:zinc finger BED domain-containing protein RICESLEEPER 2-like [Primulina eburnea]|uniref:zinc finger BED domain-containing protein RICESLEEPER 2-like n=1 Tax=Primulina eburnea TaxID=1245227 RepID=UPI003C6BDCEB
MDAKTELDRYLDEDVDVANEHFDILLWWKVNSSKFPTLAEMARDVLAIPISTVASESSFSTGGRVLDSFRSSLTPRLVQALICLQDWFRKESSPIKVEEDLDHPEEIESGFWNLRIGSSNILKEMAIRIVLGLSDVEFHSILLTLCYISYY